MEEYKRKKKYELGSEGISVKISDGFLCDRLNILSAEYSVGVEFLVECAVKHLLVDVDFVRSLRKT